MTVGEKIQYYRKREQMSQEELAHRLLVSRQTVSQWENGQTLPTIDNLMRLCEIFEISVDDLLFDPKPTEDASPTPAASAEALAPTRKKSRKSDRALRTSSLFVFLSCFDGLICGLLMLGLLLIDSIPSSSVFAISLVCASLPLACLIFGIVFCDRGEFIRKNIIGGAIVAGVMVVGCLTGFALGDMGIPYDGNYVLAILDTGEIDVECDRVIWRHGETVTLPVPSDSEFIGWFTDTDTPVRITDASGMTIIAADDVAAGERISLIPIYESERIYITLDSQNGDDNAEHPLYIGYTVGELPTPTYESFDFGGWFTEPNGRGECVTAETAVSDVAGITLYADWIIDHYTVTFDSNGSTTAMTPIINSHGSSYTLPGLAHSDSALYYLVGWELNGEIYPVGTVFEDCDMDFITYSAVWAEYCVSFYVNDTEFATLSQRLNQSYDLPNTSPQKDGYSFVGWMSESDGMIDRNTKYRKDASPRVNAVFEPKTYTVIFDARGTQSSIKVSSDSTYAAAMTKAEDFLVNELYMYDGAFLGWYTGGDGAGTRVSRDDSLISYSAHTLYAYIVSMPSSEYYGTAELIFDARSTYAVGISENILHDGAYDVSVLGMSGKYFDLCYTLTNISAPTVAFDDTYLAIESDDTISVYLIETGEKLTEVNRENDPRTVGYNGGSIALCNGVLIFEQTTYSFASDIVLVDIDSLSKSIIGTESARHKFTVDSEHGMLYAVSERVTTPVIYSCDVAEARLVNTSTKMPGYTDAPLIFDGTHVWYTDVTDNGARYAVDVSSGNTVTPDYTAYGITSDDIILRDTEDELIFIDNADNKRDVLVIIDRTTGSRVCYRVPNEAEIFLYDGLLITRDFYGEVRVRKLVKVSIDNNA